MTTQEIQSIKMRYGIIGNSPVLGRDIEVAVQVARTQLNVLITGENGTGKDIFPRIIHDYSARKHGPFFAINCGAIPEGTIDSELFGHVKGSFTDAKADRKGYFEIADGGTLFLDEVAELPLSTQARLLRVLETGDFIKVGESKVQKTNVRVVAATNVDLPRAITEGRFRQDLYYRLNAIEIPIPALRDRRDDIPLLFRKFAVDFSEQNQMPAVHLTEDARQLLMNYYWAGNVRQLKNVTEHVCLMEASRELDAAGLRPYLPENELNRTPALTGHHAESATGGAMSQDERDMLYRILDHMRKDISELHQQMADLRDAAHSAPAAVSGIVSGVSAPSAADDVAPIRRTDSHLNREDYQVAEEYHEEESATWEEIEKQSIRQALRRNGGSRKLAAAELRLSERTLYRKIKEYGLS